MSLGPYPDFAWSLTRERSLRECARRYYWGVYGGWEGWEEDAPDETRRAYRLKKLTNLDFALGAAIHRRAEELTRIARGGREFPSVRTLRRKTREEMAAVYRTSRSQFLRDPRSSPMLQSHYYGREPEEKVLERIREKLDRCLPHLRDLDLWERIRGREVRVMDLDAYDQRVEPSLEVAGIPVYANPDLVLWDPDDRRFTVVDWKTGEPRRDDRRQISVYGLSVIRNYDVQECRGRIVYLLDGSSRVEELTRDRLREIADDIRETAERMRDFVADPDVNRPRDRSAFPLTDDRWSCMRCNFFELCEEQLRDRGPLPWEQDAGS